MTNHKILNDQSDGELLLLLKQDSVAAFEELFVRYKEKLSLFCLLILKSPVAAQDIVQEVFIKIWMTRNSLKEDGSFSFFIYTLAKNQCLNELRSVKRKELMESMLSLSQEESLDADYADAKLILKEYQSLLNAAIQQLPEQKRSIFIMSRKEGLSHKEIAKKLHLSPHTIQSHISDSLRLITNYLSHNTDVELYLIFVIFELVSL